MDASSFLSRSCSSCSRLNLSFLICSTLFFGCVLESFSVCLCLLCLSLCFRSLSLLWDFLASRNFVIFWSGSINFFLSVSLELNTEKINYNTKQREQKATVSIYFQANKWSVCVTATKKLWSIDKLPGHLASIITKLNLYELSLWVPPRFIVLCQY